MQRICFLLCWNRQCRKNGLTLTKKGIQGKSETKNGFPSWWTVKHCRENSTATRRKSKDSLGKWHLQLQHSTIPSPSWLQTSQHSSPRHSSLRAQGAREEWPWIPGKPGVSGNLFYFKEKRFYEEKKIQKSMILT